MLITVYGHKRCSQVKPTIKFLEKVMLTDVEYIDIDENKQAAKFVAVVNGGNLSVPTILFSDDTTLTEPSIKMIRQKIATLRILDAEEIKHNTDEFRIVYPDNESDM